MDSTAARLVSSLLVVTAVATVGSVAVAASSPAIAVTVDGTAVTEGNATLVSSDPTVGVSVDSSRTIRVVSVRVDGTTERRYTPNATTLDESFDLSLASGNHTVEVVVKTDSVTTYSVTVTKDAERPYVQYTSPFETDRYAPPPTNPTVNRSRVVLAGNFTDVSGVTHLRILRETTYRVGSDPRVDRQVYTASDLGDSFEQPIFLGVGTNNVTARYHDELGHVREHEMRITVRDTAPPSLSNLSAVRRSPSELTIRGSVTDNGQVRSVSLRPKAGSGTTYLVEPGVGRPDPTRQRIGFETNVSVGPGRTAVVINATDTAGNAVERTVTVRRNVTPELALDSERTRFVNESAVRVGGGATDGEIVAASVETVDPESGDVVDIVSLHDGDIRTDLSFERTLDAPDGRTVAVRLRVIDSSGTEHVTRLDRTRTVATATATATPTPTATPEPTATPASTPAPTATPVTTTPDADTRSGITVPLLGVTVPVPGLLGASVTLPVPVLGPLELPVVPGVALLVVLVGAVGWVR